MGAPLPLSTTGAVGLWLVGDLLTLVLIALALRQLKPHRLRLTLWLPVAFYLYVLATAFFQLYESASPSLATGPTTLVELFGGFLLCAAVGTLLGRWGGRHAQWRTEPSSGHLQYIGGPRVVGLELAFLLPWFLRQFLYLYESFAPGASGVVVESASSPLLYFELLAGALLIVAAAIAVAWRRTLWDRAHAPAGTRPPS